MIQIKSAAQLEKMRESGRLLAQVFEMLNGFIKPGVSTMEVNAQVERFIVEELRARPASQGQYGFPCVLNTSVNDVVCHGMPNESEYLQEGDIVNCDITLEKNGFIADSSKMYCIGEVAKPAQKLIDTAYEAMWTAIRKVRPGMKLNEIGRAIQRYVQPFGYSIVREYGGHGIGQKMHEEPHVFHYYEPSANEILKEGMTFTIEPMINQGSHKIRSLTLANHWSVVLTRDKKLSAQWEHTIAITSSGYEVLTLRDEEKALGY